jgi:hypothetical protein
MAAPVVRLALGASLWATVGATPACTLSIDDLGGVGIGASCTQDAECHAGFCDDGVCAASCASDADCPAPAACYEDRCALPLHAAALWEGVVSGGEGWNLTHQEGMQYAASQLPYLSWVYEENISSAEAGAIAVEVDRQVASGASVIIANSYNQQAHLLLAADEHPDVKFLLGGGTISNGRNLVSFYSYFEQAWFTAGKVAALRAKNRIGMIVDLVAPDQVRAVNAFALGARSINPELVVQVEWIGFWLDYNAVPTFDYQGTKLYREELLTARMIESGCEIIAHNSDNQRTVRYVEAKTKAGALNGVLSVAVNNRSGYRTLTPDGPTGAPMTSCMGSAYYNFGVQQVQLLRSIHHAKLDASTLVLDAMTADPATSPVGFELNPVVGIDDSAARLMLNAVADAGPAAVFRGPYETTGQRDRDDDGVADDDQTVAVGETLSDDEYGRVCWFVRGVVQKEDPLDPHSADVEGMVPDGDVPPPPDMLPPPGVPDGVGLRCHENL